MNTYKIVYNQNDCLELWQQTTGVERGSLLSQEIEQVKMFIDLNFGLFDLNSSPVTVWWPSGPCLYTQVRSQQLKFCELIGCLGLGGTWWWSLGPSQLPLVVWFSNCYLSRQLQQPSSLAPSFYKPKPFKSVFLYKNTTVMLLPRPGKIKQRNN